MTGRKLRIPLEKTLHVSNKQAFGNQLDDLAMALKIAQATTEDSCKYNRERLARKANEQQISPGDSVRAESQVSLTSRWDPEWIGMHVKGPVAFLHHQRSGKTKVLNKEKVRIVNPESNWDDCHPRPKRKQHRSSRYQRQLIRLRNDRPDVQQQNDGDDIWTVPRRSLTEE